MGSPRAELRGRLLRTRCRTSPPTDSQTMCGPAPVRLRHCPGASDLCAGRLTVHRSHEHRIRCASGSVRSSSLHEQTSSRDRYPSVTNTSTSPTVPPPAPNSSISATTRVPVIAGTGTTAPASMLKSAEPQPHAQRVCTRRCRVCGKNANPGSFPMLRMASSTWATVGRQGFGHEFTTADLGGCQMAPFSGPKHPVRVGGWPPYRRGGEAAFRISSQAQPTGWRGD